MVIQNLMKRMAVAVASGTSSDGIGNEGLDTQVPGNDDEHPGLEADIRPEPTLVAGTFPSDLNVDAIIQSFMQEQQNSSYGPTNVDFPLMRSQDNAFGQTLNAQWAMEYDGLSLQSGGVGSVDDALFGFNNSDFEWYYSQSVQS